MRYINKVAFERKRNRSRQAKRNKKYFKKSLQEIKTSGNIFNCRQVKNLKAKINSKKFLTKDKRI